MLRRQQTLRGFLLVLTVLGSLCLNAFPLSGTVTPKKSPPNQTAHFVLQLAPVTAGDLQVSASLTCDTANAACTEAIRNATLCISGNSSCVKRAFTAAAADKNGEWQLRFSGDPLATGEAVWLEFSGGEKSNAVHAFPSPTDLAMAPDCTNKTVNVYLPGHANLELRLLRNGVLKRAPWKSPAVSDQTVIFNVGADFDATGQYQAVAVMGDERKLYPAVTAACPADQASAPQPAAQTDPSAKQQTPPPPDTTKAAPKDPVIYAAKEGDSLIQGYALGFDKVELQIYDGNPEKQAPTLAKTQVTVDASSGQFTYKVAQPLAVGQTITATGILNVKPPNVNQDSTKSAGQSTSTASPTAPKPVTLVTASFQRNSALPNGNAAFNRVAPAPPPPSPTTATVESSDLDWGRVRSYFTVGLVLSQSANNFSTNNASPFIDFNLDKTWREDNRETWGGLRVNTFFDARLTAIPTAAVATASSPATTPAVPTITPASVLLSRQAASMQVGFYLPIVMNRYQFRSQDYSLFVAPLGKTGFYTPTDTSAVTNSSNTATASSATPTRFYDFYGYGIRIGHSQDFNDRHGDTSNKGRASELLSYLDILVGKYGNFDYTSAGCVTGSSACLTQRLWRFSFEGLIKIPHTPLILGMSANLAADRSHLRGELAPQDDLRFLFGAKFDAQKVIKSLFTPGS